MEPGRRVRARTILTDDQRHILTEAFKAGLTSTGKPKLREIEGLAQQLHLSVSTVKGRPRDHERVYWDQNYVNQWRWYLTNFMKFATVDCLLGLCEYASSRLHLMLA